MAGLEGQNIGRYHILEQLGEGGMATVYKAYDTRLDCYVGFKVIRPVVKEKLETFIKRFEREAKALAQLRHPNIVHINDYGEHDGMPYLVMDYLSGGTLADKMGQPMPYQEAARLLAPVANALAFAHRLNVLHRDIKPSNILLAETGEPMLADFGIAKIIGSQATMELTDTGVGIGTPNYMAPEQWMGKADPRTDLYALGIVFYELVTGRLPYEAETPAAVLLKHVNDPLPRPRQYVPGLPEDVERVIFKCMAKKPDDRFESLLALARALENMAIGARVDIGAMPVERATEVKRNYLPWLMGGLGILGILTIIIIIAALAINQNDKRNITAGIFKKEKTEPVSVIISSPAAVETENPSAEAMDFTPTLRNTHTIPTTPTTTVTPTKTVLPTIAGGISLANIDKIELQQTLRGHAGEVMCIAFAPSGQVLASGSKDNTIGLWHVSDGEMINTLTGHSDSVRSLAFSPDGQLLASASWDKTVRLWRVSDGVLVNAFGGFNDGVRSVAFSPDGQLLAAGSWDHTVRLWRVSDLQLLYSVDNNDGVNSIAFSPDGQIFAAVYDTNKVRLYSTSDGTPLNILQGHTYAVISVAFSPDGDVLASGAGDNTVRLWSAINGAQLFTLSGHSDWVRSIDFSPDGRLIASGSKDGTVRLWLADNGAALRTFKGGFNEVNGVAFSPDNKLLASCTNDGSIHIWGVMLE